MIVGYARVSTQEQSLDAQIEELKSAGCERVFAEKESGAKSNRPALGKMMAQLTHGDVVVVTTLDRLARSTRDLFNTLGGLAEAGVGFRSLKEASVDTTTSHGRLVLGVLTTIGEFERDLIRSRMTDGRKRAVANGVRFGRKKKLTHFQRQEALARLDAGETQSVIAKTYGVDRATISRLQAT